MYNWSVDEKKFRKFPEKYKIWKLEQMINFGLGKEKLKKSELKKYINFLNIDSLKKKYLSLLLNE